MTINEIDYICTCKHNKADVQAKITMIVCEIKKEEHIHNEECFSDKIQIKCLKCNKNHFLNEDDSRCKQYFK